MKKTVLTMFLAFFVSAGFTAEKYNFGGQLRHRYEWNQKDFNSATGADNYHLLRTRINAGFSPGDGISVFLQLQDSRKFGEEDGTLTDGSADNFDLHQGYFRFNNIWNTPFSVTAGRFEAKYGPERLMGAVGWHNIGRSFDGVKLNFAISHISVDLFRLREVDTGLTDDQDDKNVTGIYGIFKPMKNMGLDLFWINQKVDSLDRHTLGFYEKSTLGPFSLSVEFALQRGDLGSLGIKAFMFAVNGDMKLNILSVSAGYERLSGGTDNKYYKIFDTMYATNHKFYGYMDYFVNIPSDTWGAGLRDIHGIVTLKLPYKTSLQGKLHQFLSDREIVLSTGKESNKFGQEMDLTLTYPYSSVAKIVAGYSVFNPGDIFKEKKGADTAGWFYLMTIVNF